VSDIESAVRPTDSAVITKPPWWAWVLLTVFVMYVSLKLNGWLTEVGTGDPKTAWTIAAVPCVPFAVVLAFKSWQKEDLWLPGPLIPIAVVLAFGVFEGAFVGAQDHEHGYIADYCKYGAVSQAQLDGCRRHVDSRDIENLDTDAARFARRDLDDCLSDSGPYCYDALAWRLAKDQEPAP